MGKQERKKAGISVFSIVLQPSVMPDSLGPQIFISGNSPARAGERLSPGYTKWERVLGVWLPPQQI